MVKGGPKVTKPIEDSVYDTKPVNYTSIVLEEFKWNVKENDCFYVETDKVLTEIPMHELINKYNN